MHMLNLYNAFGPPSFSRQPMFARAYVSFKDGGLLLFRFSFQYYPQDNLRIRGTKPCTT